MAGGFDGTLPVPVRHLVSLVAGHANGVALSELTSAAQARFVGIHPRRVADLAAQAVKAGVLSEVDGRFWVRAEDPEPESKSAVRTVVRAVTIDVESVVRTTARAPYVDRRIYQIGAVRFGNDEEWVRAAPRFSRFIELPSDGIWEIVSDSVRAEHERDAIAPGEALSELHEFCDTSDTIVTYNGTVVDFPLLIAAYEREGLPTFEVATVDAYYLALALWPTAPTHRLAELVDLLGIDRNGLSWHDAADDAELLARLIMRATSVLRELPTKLIDLIMLVCRDSTAWTLLGKLGNIRCDTDRLGHADVAALLAEQLAGHVPRRRAISETTPILVNSHLRGSDGRVDSALLAEVAHGGDVERRPAQEQMTRMLHSWADDGVPALIEAPTGTGKSFAVLAAALDWLSGGHTRTAIITTFTKQLQAQLANDLARLEGAVPGLLDSSDLVKGQTNRLSLRALVATLSDAVSRTSDPGTGSSKRNRFLAKPTFREVLVYIALRLRSATEVRDSWAAHSVDPVDLPAFFGDYCGSVLPVWLESLSQASNGEYPPDAGASIASHTDVVREALSSHRLLLANHALLLAHLDDLSTLGDDTLLIIDEAHQLEDAATSALTTTFDYQAAEDLFAELTAWIDTARPGAQRDAIRGAVDHLGFMLDNERLPRAVSQALDARGIGAGVEVGGRTTTLASAYVGSGGIGHARSVSALLLRFRGQYESLIGALSAYLSACRLQLDFFDSERVKALLTRCSEMRESAHTIISDIGMIVDAQPSLIPEMSNRVIYVEELAALRAGLRSYRFRIATSPIDLGADGTWKQFLDAFDRTYYVSATLTVAGRWDFIRDRLALPADIAAIDLPTPFDLSSQAELVCFTDFPSWAEQSESAMRTVAHQLAGYAREIVRPASRGGYDGGGLVLTTARSTAGGIADYLATELRQRGDLTPVLSALLLGNARGVQEFTSAAYGGGFLVGTKGLWQGVDVSDADRMRLVWINKLPFAPFAAPVVEARRAAVAGRAEAAHVEDPDAVATRDYYLPLAALQLRQAVGRLIRSSRHRGVIVISDRKLGGTTAVRRAYRQMFLGSLDPGLMRADPVTGEPGGGNVVPMAEGWARIWSFVSRQGLLATDRAAQLSTVGELDQHTLLPQTRKIRDLELTPSEVVALRAEGRLIDEVVERAAVIGGLLRLSDIPADLKESQRKVISAVAKGQDVLGLLPTGFGKSFCFQLPALVLPGVTIVVSPLVALMLDQALDLNRSIGGAVRALIGPLRESSSRAGKSEVSDQLLDRAKHGIRLVYVSPERLCQRRFREVVRTAVKLGTVTRIVLDEAHTVVQWDDFRPAMTRVEQFLAELRTAFGLPVTALTATANRTVYEGLRRGVFGVAADDAHEAMVTVRENPIRPELAIFRRRLEKAGPAVIAGLAEQVLGKIDDHSIFYCLTVKEVVALHAHLRDYLGEAGTRVRRFHGRLTEAEKSAVLTEFREAPRRDDDEFAPLVIVATSAFGLGVNREDVRTVFCVSAPTDLSALYQQIGRAGRDAASVGRTGGRPNVGLALLTTRGLRTVKYMTGTDLPASLLNRMGRAVLSSGRVLDPVDLADRFIGEDLAAGRLTPGDARESRTVESYVSGVMRGFATLAAMGAVEDLGDFPPICTAKPGELLGKSRPSELELALVELVLASPTRAKLDVVQLDRQAASTISGYRELAENPAATWQTLADFHDRGLLDVSAAPSRRLVTGLRVINSTLPSEFHREVTGKVARAAEEIRLLREFFQDTTVCANRKFADYFGVDELPEGCCSNASNRCSACWNDPTWPPGESRPSVIDAFETSHPALAGRPADSALLQRRLDDQVHRMIWDVRAGLHPNDLYNALRGEDTYYVVTSRRRVPLRRALINSRYFGANPGVRIEDVHESLARLVDNKLVVQVEKVWRNAMYVQQEKDRTALQ